MWTILDVILIWTGYVGPADGSAYNLLKMLITRFRLTALLLVDSGDGFMYIGLHITSRMIAMMSL